MGPFVVGVVLLLKRPVMKHEPPINKPMWILLVEEGLGVDQPGAEMGGCKV